MSAQVEEGYFSKLYELPDGAVQLYLRDPAGNMVEVNYPDAASLDNSVIGKVERVPSKTQEAAKAKLHTR